MSEDDNFEFVKPEDDNPEVEYHQDPVNPEVMVKCLLEILKNVEDFDSVPVFIKKLQEVIDDKKETAWHKIDEHKDIIEELEKELGQLFIIEEFLQKHAPKEES